MSAININKNNFENEVLDVYKRQGESHGTHKGISGI